MVVIGASAGGIEASKALMEQFPTSFPAAVFLTLHMFERSETILASILGAVAKLPVKYPGEKEPIVPGQIYVAPPDYHLVLSPGWVALGHGPKENLQRPCINVMFRSAAKAYGPDAVGVILTGMLDDGASGLWEIKQSGGVAIVQDPKEAMYRSMPESAIRGFDVDYIVRLGEMGALLNKLVSGGANVNEDYRSATVENQFTNCNQTCPECGGVMKRGRQARMYEYRCHVGHRLGLKTMISEKMEVIERAISAALAQTQELLDLLDQARQQGDSVTVSSLDDEIRLRREQESRLRALLQEPIYNYSNNEWPG